MHRLAPGNVLQLMYVKHRLRRAGYRRFYEVGAGNGYLSRALLGLGLDGVAFDLNADACDHNRALNRAYIEQGRFDVRCADFLTADVAPGVDLVASSMVLEHLPSDELDRYLERAVARLRPAGTILSIVPAGKQFWGIEDDVAGHLRRFEREDLVALANRHRLRVAHVAGLTYPLSNLLLPISNRLVERAEAGRLRLDERTRTIASGNRAVAMKTVFPSFFRLLINEVTLWPLFVLQLMFRGHPDAMVLYCEMRR